MKPFPWLSLSLLLGAYSTFSWFLYQSTIPWLVWCLILTFALVQALLLTTFSQGLRQFIGEWLQSDIGYFSMVALGAFSIAVILVWYNIFEYIMLVIGTEILARLDLQEAGCNKWVSFVVLTAVSISGLAIGSLVSEII